MKIKLCNLRSVQDILWYQWIGSIGVMLALTISGIMAGMFSPLIAQLTADNSPLRMTSSEISWMTSSWGVAAAVGAILGSFVAVPYFGSKMTLVVTSIPFGVSWILLILADSPAWIHSMVIVHGLGLGLAIMSFPIYVGEVATSASRGTFVNFAGNGPIIGSLMGNLLTTNLSTTLCGLSFLAPTILYVILLLSVPESPYHLISTKQFDKAKESIMKYNPKVSVNEEFLSIKEFIASSNTITFCDQLREFKSQQQKKFEIIIILLLLFVQFGGVQPILFYNENILTKGGVNVMKPSLVVTLSTAISIVAGWIFVDLVDRLGRRLLWIIAAAGSCLCMLAIGIRFSLLGTAYDMDALQWLPIFSILFWRIFVHSGLVAVAHIYQSELLSPNIKTLGICVGNICSGIFATIANTGYQPLIDNLGYDSVFYTFAAFMALAVIFGCTSLPETKGKSLQEIQNMQINQLGMVGVVDRS
ncbi:facilitated trehalose transporter Tret1-like [Athalia rosae]|uniref:facilitated trehalose transporter Tret1-like n=1 Tax=Athalia rosae TaxID=37344 RepID=UPI0020344189|nr:facilitated trehalose transporter Tret1-like [Athalia rosae]